MDRQDAGEVAISQSTKAGIDFTGTVDHVAGMMQEIMEEVGGDGFQFFNATFDRRYVTEVCDGGWCRNCHAAD